MARCSGCHKRFKKGEVWPWTDQVLWPWTDQVFKYEFCKPCHPKGGYAAEIRIGDVVEYFSTREDTERQWVGKVEDKLPRGISSCKLPMLKIAGKPGYVLESHCQIRKEESPAPTPVMDFVPADLLEAEAMKNSEHKPPEFKSVDASPFRSKSCESCTSLVVETGPMMVSRSMCARFDFELIPLGFHGDLEPLRFKLCSDWAARDPGIRFVAKYSVTSGGAGL